MNRFVWSELFTTDTDSATRFYTRLLGWTVESTPIGERSYWTIYIGGKGIGGIAPAEQTGRDSAWIGGGSYWIGTLAVPDVAATTAAALSLGATNPGGISDGSHSGRYARIVDPQGVGLMLGSGIPAEFVAPAVGDSGELGAVAWNELLSDDVAASRDFYGRLLGWVAAEPASGPFPYTLFTVGGYALAGATPRPDDLPRPMWLPYFEVADVDASAARIAELGGRTLTGMVDAPGVRFAWASDPTGAVFALQTSVPPR